MQKKNIFIAIIIVVIVAGGSFFGGMKYGQQTKGLKNLPAGFAQNGQGMPNRNGQNGRGNMVVGEVISKDDKSLTIKTQDGSTKTVYFTDSTTVTKSAKGTVNDLSTGAQVSTEGTSNSDGSIAANTIQIR